jgi:hypothetical protein
MNISGISGTTPTAAPSENATVTPAPRGRDEQPGPVDELTLVRKEADSYDKKIDSLTKSHQFTMRGVGAMKGARKVLHYAGICGFVGGLASIFLPIPGLGLAAFGLGISSFLGGYGLSFASKKLDNKLSKESGEIQQLTKQRIDLEWKMKGLRDTTSSTSSQPAPSGDRPGDPVRVDEKELDVAGVKLKKKEQ